MTRSDLTAFLRSLDALALAALLRELGVELYRREVVSWRVLSELSDELIDSVTFAARRKLITHVAFTARKRPTRPRASRRRRSDA